MTTPVAEGRYGRVQVALVGKVRVRCHTSVPPGASSMTVSLDPHGRWHITWHGVAVERGVPSPPPTRIVALDLGVAHLAHVVAWDPVTGEWDRWILDRDPSTDRRAQIATLKERVERRQPGSTGRRRAVERLAATRNAAREARRLDERRIASALLRDAATVAVEVLDSLSMRRSGKVRRDALSRAGMAAFVTTLKHSAETRPWARVVLVEPAGTTRTCSLCRARRGPLPLSQRVWRCDGCGACLHRDWNAAVNVLVLSFLDTGSGPDLVTRRRLATVSGSG